MVVFPLGPIRDFLPRNFHSRGQPEHGIANKHTAQNKAIRSLHKWLLALSSRYLRQIIGLLFLSLLHLTVLFLV